MGCGLWGRNIVRNFYNLEVLDTVCDLDEENLAKVKEQYPNVKTTKDFNDILNNPEITAVAVITPSHTHFKFVKMFLESGRHVYVEKPISTSAKDAQTLKEIAADYANTMQNFIPLKFQPVTRILNEDKEAILQLSDWHYGIVVNSYWNKYDTEIARQRIQKLRDEVVSLIKKENISALHVVNLGDLIAGNIHLTIRLNSRINVIKQIMDVSELLTELIVDLSNYCKIYYYDTLDNHSRIEPIRENSLELESLACLTSWYLQARFDASKQEFPVYIKKNVYSPDIITFDVLGHSVAGVHGHKDKPEKVVDNLILMTKQDYDLILTSHLHHFSCDEKNEVLVVSNSSLMGTDDYAAKLRLSAKPSQNMIIVTKNNVAESIHRILLELD